MKEIPKTNQTSGNLPFVGDYLSDKIRVFYGPGQRPDSGLGQIVADDDANNIIPAKYLPPKRWPKNNVVLSAPQVVFLGVEYQLSLTVGNDQLVEPTILRFLGTAGLNYEITYWLADGEHTTTWIDEDGIEPIFYQPNAYRVELHRLLDVYAEVKEFIETIRKDRTFVDFYDYSKNGGKYFMGNTVVGFLAPPLEEKAYFGTDFFHIYAGGVAICRVYDEFSFSFLDAAHETIELELFDEFLNSTERIKAAHKLFYSYKNDIYGPTMNDYYYPPNKIKSVNDRASLQTCCTLLNDYGVEYKGTSDLLTKDYIVKQIAARYKFHPATGKDLT